MKVLALLLVTASAEAFTGVGMPTRLYRTSARTRYPATVMHQQNAGPDSTSRRSILLNSLPALALAMPLQSSAYAGLNIASKKKKTASGPSPEQKATQEYAATVVARDARALASKLADDVTFRSARTGFSEAKSKDAVASMFEQAWGSDPKGSATYGDMSDNTFVIKYQGANPGAFKVSLTFGEGATGNLGNGIGKIVSISEEPVN
eukprot:Tamp_22210.p1 GENE.Tamp_22210~~Tamp_22210.p1  ORF type:complete len:206 (-),score=32.16 Tamp_22210:485-1102(-)